METDKYIEIAQKSVGSYRTYEEWKPKRMAAISGLQKSSYRTYEEWKLLGALAPFDTTICSYRTYEEWKQ